MEIYITLYAVMALVVLLISILSLEINSHMVTNDVSLLHLSTVVVLIALLWPLALAALIYDMWREARGVGKDG